MKQFIIDESLAQEILAYLDDKSVREVYKLVDGLMHLQEVKETTAVVK